MAGWNRRASGLVLVLIPATAGASSGALDPGLQRTAHSTLESTWSQEPATPVADVVSARELRTISMDLLGRPPLAGERDAAAKFSRAQYVSGLSSTREFWEHWLDEQLYYFLLINNFRPQGERFTSMPGDLAEQRLDVRSALHRIGLSSSFEQRNPGADTFVTVVLEQLAGLDVTRSPRELEIGKKVYDGADGTFLGQRGKTQADIVRIAIDSPQAARHFLAREHRRLVHADPNPRDLTAWVARWTQDPRVYLQLVREWFASDAYAQRLHLGAAQENRLFVRTLYVDLLDRLPTQEEAEPLREALDGLADPTPLRSVVVRLLLDSGKCKLPERKDIADGERWIESLFQRWLARAPSAAERASFGAAFADPACLPRTVVQALVSSAEYARY